MAKYNISLDIAPLGDDSEETLLKKLQLALQTSLTTSACIINKVDVKQSGTGGGGKSKPRSNNPGGTPGRKPINRPKVERWIRENVTCMESTQGTVGLQGVDSQGRPLQAPPNRVYAHILVLPEPQGVGLSPLAVDKVLRELAIEGYLERGYAAGAPFYEYVKPLPEEGSGIRGKDEVFLNQPVIQKPKPATVHEVDFSGLDIDPNCPGYYDRPFTLTTRCTVCDKTLKEHL